MYKIKYIEKLKLIVIEDHEKKTGVVLCAINNVGPGMAAFLTELVRQANHNHAPLMLPATVEVSNVAKQI